MLEQEAETLTPWECHEGVWFKREDKFAPLGYGGPNGSKLRQLIHLFQRYRGNATRVITAASVLSPQHSMTAYVGNYFGLPTHHIIASKSPEAHTNTAIAKMFGATFSSINVGYNPMLQRELQNQTLDSDFVIPYGITTEDPERIPAFHEVGARQVSNLPPEVKTLYCPAGSCNSLTSIIKGLSRDSKNVERLVSVGIGPDKVEWTKNRLRIMGVDPDRLPFEWDHSVSLHAAGVKYGDRVRESWGEIEFHPIYEGKLIRYLKQHDKLKPGSGVWVVGSEPKKGALLSALSEL